MIGTIRRTGWRVVALIALVAVAALAAGCGGTDGNTTSSATSTTVASTGDSTNETTVVSGGKTLAEYQAEIPELEKAITADPSDLTSLEKLAVASYQLGNYEAAEGAYLKILAVTNDAFTRNNLGNVYRDWQKPDQAIAEYEAAIALDPTLKYPYINLAGVYKTQGDLAKATEILDKAKTALNTDDAKAAADYQDSLTSTTTT